LHCNTFVSIKTACSPLNAKPIAESAICFGHYLS
jgi:hypothetical protein